MGAIPPNLFTSFVKDAQECAQRDLGIKQRSLFIAQQQLKEMQLARQVYKKSDQNLLKKVREVQCDDVIDVEAFQKIMREVFKRYPDQDVALQRQYAQCLEKASHAEKGYQNSIEQLKKRMKQLSQTEPGSEHIAWLESEIGGKLYDQENWEGAMVHFQKAQNLFRTLGKWSFIDAFDYRDDIARLNYNIALTERMQKKTRQSIHKFRETIALYEGADYRIREECISACYLQISLQTKDRDRQLDAVQRGLDIYGRYDSANKDNPKDCPCTGFLYGLKGAILYDIGNSVECIKYLQKAISIFERHSPVSSELATLYFLCEKAHKNLGNEKESLEMHKEYIRIAERLYHL